MRALRIALVAPVHEACPPPGYGGIELVVSLLAEGLWRRGHHVTLFATGDSVTPAELRWTEPTALRRRRLTPGESLAAEIIHVKNAFAAAGEFDVIHNHTGIAGIAMAGLVKTPVLSTLHGPFTLENAAFFEALSDHPYVAISRAQQDLAPRSLRVVGVVHNGIDTAGFRQRTEPGRLVPPELWGRGLLFLGRVSREKGTHLACQVARRCGLPLTIAGKIDAVDEVYWKAEVQPHVDGHQIRYIGEVGGDRKREVLAGSLALLHPVQWPEPFGLVMVEAMACGTPVIALSDGSIPEVVDDRITGYVCDDVDQMVAAVERLEYLDRQTIREVCRTRFDAATMVDSYLALYEELIADPLRMASTRDA